MPEIISFAERHLKLYDCACSDADLTFSVGTSGCKVICRNCGENTNAYANPDKAYWEWVNKHQHSTEVLFEKVLEAFKK
ncbi:MAG: hypothetical protein V3V74_07265 [Nitrosomonadaceae bacterium]